MVKDKNSQRSYGKIPTRMVESAVKGMLPKTTLGRAMYKNYLFMQVVNILIKHKANCNGGRIRWQYNIKQQVEERRVLRELF